MSVNACLALSGGGSLTEAILDAGVPISLLLADRDSDRKCRIREIAQKYDIPYEIVPRTFDRSFDRYAHTVRTIQILKDRDIGAVFMAGYNTIFHGVMFEAFTYRWRVTNTHPALLPMFPGHYAVRDTLSAGVNEAGCTIHHATEVMDDPRYIIAQRTVPVVEGDTEDSLWERIKVEERKLYPEVIKAFTACLEAGESPLSLKV